MNINNGEDLLALLNRLLEGLHQAGMTNFGSHLSIVYVASGAQHVDTVQNQYVQTPLPDLPRGEPHPNPLRGERESLPDVLATPKAMALWEKAQRAGYVDKHYQPLLSRTQSALLADVMAKRLGIKEKWKVFEALWNRKNMYKDLYYALNQKQSLVFQDKLKAIL